MKTNMEQFPGKRVPYKESDEYVARLISECADKAVRKQPQALVVKVVWRVCAVAAIMLSAVLMFFNLTGESEYERYLDSAPLSEVLSQMSDEDLMCVSYYEEYEIPEYDE